LHSCTLGAIASGDKSPQTTSLEERADGANASTAALGDDEQGGNDNAMQ
jgi:hypothetical protein